MSIVLANVFTVFNGILTAFGVLTLTYVPEPGTLGLIALAGIPLLARRRR